MKLAKGPTPTINPINLFYQSTNNELTFHFGPLSFILLPVAMHIVKRNKSTPLYIKEVKVYTAPDSIYKRNYRLEKRQPPVSMKTMFF
ncbi:MAG: hypothetical protein OET81_11335, partial [Desulfobacteraceae bacterium]|nr:hypothetical protein [Desulfobacteraceae bacterium]